MLGATVISIGTELTLGQSVDTNAAWLSRELASVGVRCGRHATVSDSLDDICEEMRLSAARSDVVLITGGLGPTEDDLTREALARVSGGALREDAAALEQIRIFFVRRGREMPDRNRVQALCPAGGRLLENRNGTAPGVFVSIGRTACYAMPGVPSEMKAMFAEQVLPNLRAMGGGRTLRTRLLHTIGLPESELGARIADLMARGRNPEVGTTADIGAIGIRINADAATTSEADAMLDETEREIRRRLGVVVFGADSDTLAGVVGAQLAARGATVCTAESCTGGMIASALTDTPGSSAYFLGAVVTYANEAKHDLLDVPSAMIAAQGAVSATVAEHMAVSARRRFRATYALSSTGVAGPAGGSPAKPVGLVFVGLAGPSGVRSWEHRFGEDSTRAVARLRAVRTALGALRAALLAT